MDSYDAMAGAVDKILLESKFGRRRQKLRNHDKEKTEIQHGRDGRISRISKPYPVIFEHESFRGVNGANGNKVDGDARKIKEHLNVSGARQENDYGQNKGIGKFSQRFKAAVTKKENETEMERAIRKMIVYLMESGKRDENENETDVATRKMMEILNEYHRISFDREMLQKGKSVGKCIGSFNTLEDKFLNRISEPNCDNSNLLTELEKRKFEYVETQIREMEYAITSLEKEMDALTTAIGKIVIQYLIDKSQRHLKMNGKYEETLGKLHHDVQFVRDYIRERSNITDGSPMSDTLPLLERMVTDSNVLTTSPTPNAMAPPNVSFSESQKTPRNQRIIVEHFQEMKNI
ncbi:hypothetical protein Bhyg_08294 [Pseudolycoriella hygida]|uniref:Uncharacterized protein n=1 Tax=Pseudolycoriella hygida TaxID=35572 RepID=A0A9Q0S3H2_9DIPT|nr:hypothetical protein Bhyg_08294 [Pseudolycoriella hygida]